MPGEVRGSDAFVPTTIVPFDHEYVPPPLAVSVIDVVAHVKVFVDGELIIATGGVIFCVIVCDVDAEHPFAPVTVTV